MRTAPFAEDRSPTDLPTVCQTERDISLLEMPTRTNHSSPFQPPYISTSFSSSSSMPQQRLGRSWGTRFDSLTSSDSLSSNPESVVASSHRVSSPPRSISADESNSVHETHERMLQDASIFIGSLPSNMDYAELTSLLSQHLSEHPQVKGIKVVRDSKGGACAFIQCQDSEAASALMHNLQVAAPQPFLGRYLRYEPARAFRTLLISYRSPRPYHHHQREPPRKAYFPSSEAHGFVEFQLPNSMRIIRMPGNRQFTLLYNSSALETPLSGDVDPGLLLVPLLYDAETLLQIASVFGAVDYFGPYAYGNEASQISASFPPPHDAPRSSGQDPGCWKVKWAHRDDCVSALLTLRRVPHLTVTWAHQSNILPREYGFYNNPRQLPVIPASRSWRSRGTGPALRSAPIFLPPSHTFPAFRSTEDASVVERQSDQAAKPSPGCNTWQQEKAGVPNDQNMISSRAPRPRALSLTYDRPQPTVPLPSRESTGQLSFINWESTSRTRWADHVESTEFKGNPNMAGPKLTSSYLDRRIEPSDSDYHTPQEGDSQEIEAGTPCIPDFGASPLTPRTPASLMLRTPTTASYVGDFQSMTFRDYDSQGSLPQLLQDKRDDLAVDPTTIFVGGLEMHGPNAWDEGKVRALFSKYGGIESVKVIRPSHKYSAFAFVKFNNTESPARAIRAEHNRILDGRLIRVQLRDWNPPCRSWRPITNKSEPQPLPTIDDSCVDRRLPGASDNVATNMADLQLSDSPAHPTSTSPTAEACGLNEVQNETKILSSELPFADGPEGDPANEVCGTGKLSEVKQGEPAPLDATLVSSQTPMPPVPPLPGAYPAPTIQYWIPNYTPQFSYQIPFAGQPYPGYPLPPPVAPPPPQSGGPDNNGAPSYPSIPFGPIAGAYPTFISYPPPVSHSSDLNQAAPAHHGAVNNATLFHTQAPLIPTGFITGDQGMFVPVYPPDALNQYMAGNQDQGQAPTNSGTTEGQLPITWRPYPPPPVRPQAVVFHSYFNPPLTTPPLHPLGSHGWIPGPTWQGAPPQSGNGHGVPGRGVSTSPVGGPASTPMGSTSERNVMPRRHYRRDNHVQHHKNNFGRGPGGRFGKPSFEAGRPPTDTQPPQITSGPSIDANWQH